MPRLNEKQLLILTIAGSLVFVAGFCALIWWDLDRIHAAEITDDNPEAAEIADQELWGERRWIQHLEQQIEGYRAEAELIAQREQDVIVYREIVARDAAILPGEAEVTRLTTTVGDFVRMAGVTLTRLSDLNTNADGAAIATIPIKLQLTGSFDEVLKFINLFETLDRIVNVTAFNISGGKVEGEGSERKAYHAVNLDLVTYMYSSTAGLAKPVEISNYERRKNDPVIQKLIRQQKAAFVEKYQLQPRLNRRDPLIDPRRSAEEMPDGLDASEAGGQQELVSKLKFDVEMLKDDVRQERFYAREKKYVPLSQLTPLVDTKFTQLEEEILAADTQITIPELREILHDDVVVPFEDLKAQRSVKERPKLISYAQVQEFVRKMRTAMDEMKFDEVVELHNGYQTFVTGMEVSEDAHDLLVDMQEMRKEAEVTLDFEALNLRYSGSILRPTEKQVIDGEEVLVNPSVVLINGKAHRVDSYVDGEGRCKVIEITKDFVVYDFDGFEIRDPLVKK